MVGPVISYLPHPWYAGGKQVAGSRAGLGPALEEGKSYCIPPERLAVKRGRLAAKFF
jgi:hypothetical protein